MSKFRFTKRPWGGWFVDRRGGNREYLGYVQRTPWENWQAFSDEGVSVGGVHETRQKAAEVLLAYREWVREAERS